MTTLEQDIAALTQFINSLGPLVIAVTNISVLVFILVGVIQNGRQSRNISLAVNAHSKDITAIKKQTDGINTALTTKAAVTDAQNTELVRTNATLTERLLNGDSTKGPTP